MVNSLNLTKDELIEITGGARQKAAQARVLKAAKIHFWYGIGGKSTGELITTRYLINHPMLGEREEEPEDLPKMENVS